MRAVPILGGLSRPLCYYSILCPTRQEADQFQKYFGCSTPHPSPACHYGNTPIHYAAEGGKADCFNCCLQHDADLTIRNIKGDSPLDTAKKNGHPLLMERAIKNEVTCPLCFVKFEKEEYDRIHAPAPVERSITTAGSTAYTSPLPVLKTPMSSLVGAPAQRHSNTHQKNLFKSDLQKKKPTKKLPNRDLPTKYFGEYLDPNEVFKFKI
ncbi:ankyrin repeat domain-containing protein 42-like [Plakobranchus ocellatus]|uniref:Ankyrin repeat domain-containing protein 42-like n=1 Tax=Plakobranchus ocellatus TaxID=259542 RepID=A0AAV4DHK1_9GAST|nr:ankyrin repeat domain-containing protein 42-like [Plakobranchus ocellatus]